MKPVIGITLGYDEGKEDRLTVKESYITVVKSAGGIPLLLPPQIDNGDLLSLTNVIDGVLLTGGGDVDPVYFNEEPDINLRRIDPLRDKFEIELVKLSIKEKIPLLGICKGMQVINIVCGGSVIQHLDSQQIKHDQNAPLWYPTHSVNFSDDSLLGEIFAKKTIRVNSYHHQILGKLGEGIEVTARASDNAVEGITAAGHPFLHGVQWHPERMYRNEPDQLNIFKELIKKSLRS